MHRLPLALMALSLSACGGDGDTGNSGSDRRGAGPHSSERGEILFWQMAQPDLSYASCTDDQSFRDLVSSFTMDVSGNVLAYQLEADGTQATPMDCASLDASSCVPIPGPQLDIIGHSLFYTPDTLTEDIPGTTCDLMLSQSWMLVDHGAALDADASVVLDLVGDRASCAAFEMAVETAAPNGQGIEGCVVTISSTGDFIQAVSP